MALRIFVLIISNSSIYWTYEETRQIMSQQTRQTAMSFPKIYDRRDGTENLGAEFEIKITALLALRCISLEDTKDMWMGSNVDHIGDFDDIVLFRETTGGRRVVYMLQLKHQQNATDIAVHEFLNDKLKKKHFLLSKYSESYISLKKILGHSPAGNEHQVIQCLRKADDTFFIIFTNRGVDVNQCNFLDVCCDRTVDFLDTSCGTGNRFTFNIGNLKNFKLFTHQVHAKKASNLIQNELNNLSKPSPKLQPMISKNNVKEFTEFIKTWSKGAEVNDAKICYTLTKFDIVCKLTDILLRTYKYNILGATTQYLQKRVKYDSCQERLHNVQEKPIWSQITYDRNIIIMDSDDVAEQFLLQHIGNEVGQYLSAGFEKNWEEELSEETLHLIHENDIDLEMNLLKIIGKRENITMLDLYTSLWFNKKMPMLLKIQNEMEYKAVMRILNLSNYNLHVIIMKNKNVVLEPQVGLSMKYFITLDDLDDKHKNAILNESVKLQNRPGHTLGKLVDESMYKLITCNDVIHILQGNFNVGNEYGPLSDFHISRSLCRVFLDPKVLNEIKNEKFILTYHENCEKKTASGNSYFPNNMVIQQPENLETVASESVVHTVVIHRDSTWEWKSSSGTTINILKYVIPGNSHWTSLEAKKDYFFNDTHVITADPGMGKTTFADFMALQAPANTWVIKITLNKYEDYYDKIKNESGYDHLNFFADQLLKNCNNLELCKAIFDKCLTSKQVLVILDGFDEIVIRHEKEVIQMTKCLHEEKFPLWITTRPNKKCDLEETFSTIALTLNSLSIDERLNLLTKYFTQACKYYVYQDNFTSVIERFVDKLFEVVRCNFYDNETFMGIPLHVILLAEVFSGNCEEALKSNNIILEETFNLVDLYEKFIKRKLDILSEKFGNEAKNLRMCMQVSKYQKLFALKYLYPEYHLRNLKVIEDLNEFYSSEDHKIHCLQREGIVVVEQIHDGKKIYHNINFTHRTFAEFLAAQWFAENICNPNYEILNVIRSPKFFRRDNLVYNMLNLILARNCPLHTAVLNGNVNEAERILQRDPNRASECDEGGRTILHIIAIKYNEYPRFFNQSMIKDLVQKMPNVIVRNTKDLVRNFTALDYALLTDTFNNYDYSLANQMCYKFSNLTITYSQNRKEHFISDCTKHGYKSLFKIGLRYYAFKDLLLHRANVNNHIDSFCTVADISSAKQEVLNDYIRDVGVTTISELLQFKTKASDISIAHYYYDIDVACALGTRDNVSYLLTEGVEIKRLLSETTPLHYAARRNSLEIVKLLLDSEVDINKPDESGRTALHWAASPDIINELLLKGANIDKLDIDGNTPLTVALMEGNLSTARYLLIRGVNVTLANTYGNLPLHCTVTYDSTDVISLILKKGACVNTQNTIGDTSLHLALRKRNLGSARLLLSNSANVNLDNHDGTTALHLAALYNYVDIIPELINKGASIDKQDKEGYTPLNWALKKRNLDAARLLLLNGANCNLENKNGASLHLAGYHGCTDIIPDLMAKGALINKQDNNGDTPLNWIFRKGHLDAAKSLLLYGANVNLENNYGRSSLHLAASHGCTDLIPELLAKGASIDKQDNYGDTPLHWSLENGNLDSARLLLSKGAKVDLGNRDGRSALHLAATFGYDDMIPELAAKGACVNKQNQDGDTPLHLAVDRLRASTVEQLLKAGAKINLQNEHGRTPLHAAVCKQLFLSTVHFNDRLQVVRLLLDKGADVNILDKEGNTPLYCCKQNVACCQDEGSYGLSTVTEFTKIVEKLILGRK